MGNRRALLFLGLTAPYLISYFQRSAPAVVGSQIALDMGLPYSSLGMLMSMYAWGYAAAQLPAGLLSDTLGSRKTITFCVLIAAVGSIVFALSSNFTALCLGRLLVGLGVGFVYVPAVRVMVNWYRPNELATYSGLLLGVGNIGALLSAGPLALLLPLFGWRNLFFAVAAATLFSALFCWMTVFDRPDQCGLAVLEKTAQADAAKADPIEALSKVFSNGRFYLIAFLLFCYYGTLLSFGSLWAGPYLQDTYKLSGQTVGNILMMTPLGFLFGCPLSGYLSDRILKSRKKVLLWGSSLHILAYLPLIFMIGELSTAWLYALFLWYGLTGSAFVINYACAKETVESRFAGTALGAINIFLFLGGAFFQAALGFILEGHSTSVGVYPVDAYQNALLFAAGGLLISVITFLFFRENSAIQTVQI